MFELASYIGEAARSFGLRAVALREPGFVGLGDERAAWQTVRGLSGSPAGRFASGPTEPAPLRLLRECRHRGVRHCPAAVYTAMRTGRVKRAISPWPSIGLPLTTPMR